MNDFSWTQIGAHIPRLSTRGCRRRLFGCFILLMLFLAGLCGLLFWLVRPSSAQSPASTAVYLVIDNSNSMFEMGGIGADPDLLRLDAARLFISYLGVDQNRAVHQCGVIFFGSQADVVVPLTPLTDDSRRAELFSLLGEPDRMGWSDHAEALALAHKQLRLAQPHGRSAIIFLTDGKPEWSNAPTAVEQAAYIARLKQISRELAASQTDLFMILLANQATDADETIADVWQPLWQEMAAATDRGQFYTARHADALIETYHQIAVTLTGGQTTDPVVTAEIPTAGLTKQIAVEPGLARMTLVISKSDPAIATAVLKPDDEPLRVGEPGVRYAGRPGDTHEEIWAIDLPAPGVWTVRLAGAGRVTVWKDVVAAAAPAQPVRPTQTPTLRPLPAETAVSLPVLLTTATIQPTIPAATQPQVPDAARLVGQMPVFAEGAGSSGWARLWFMLLPVITALLAMTGGYGVWRRKRLAPPAVTGTLRLLTGSGATAGPAVFDLDAMQRPIVAVGQEPADIPLPGCVGRVMIRAGSPLGDTFEVLIEGDAYFLLDDDPVTTTRRLQDAATITLGAAPQPVYRLRYENLRLRSAQVAQAAW